MTEPVHPTESSSAKQRSSVRATLYTRPPCNCSQNALEVLREHGVETEIVTIERTPEWVALHGDATPVVAINDRVRFRGRIDPVLLKRLIKRAE